jgi:hypothetical protein
MLQGLCNAPIEPHVPRESSVVQTIQPQCSSVALCSGLDGEGI